MSKKRTGEDCFCQGAGIPFPFEILLAGLKIKLKWDRLTGKNQSTALLNVV